jgi:hypothetical protein
MTIRHKAVKTSLSTGYASEWNDDHHIDFTNELTECWTFSSTNLDDDFTTSTSGTASISVGMSNNHNFLNLTTGTTANSVASVRLGNNDVTNKLDTPIFTTALKLESVDLAEFGFFTFAGSPFTANQKGAYFRIVSGILYAVTGNGTTEQTTNLGAISQYEQYKIEFTSTQVRFYVGDLMAIDATHTQSIPSDNLTLKINIKNQDTTNRILRVDGLALTRLRKK